jgi:PAS domain S-box-containing protein
MPKKIISDSDILGNEMCLQLLDILPENAVITNFDGVIQFYSLNMAKAFAYTTREQLKNESLSSLVSPDERSELFAYFKKITKSKTPMQEQFSFIKKDGVSFPGKIISRRLPGDAKRVLSVIRDITASKRMEEELEKAREVFKRMHENPMSEFEEKIKIPLYTVIEMAEMAQKSTANPDDCPLQENAAVSTDILFDTAAEMLEFARIEAGGFKIENSEFFLFDALEHSLNFLKHRAAGKNLKIATSIQFPSETKLVGDQFHTKQVLLRIAKYIIKHTSKGKVDVRVAPAKNFSDCLNYSGGTRLHFAVVAPSMKLPALVDSDSLMKNTAFGANQPLLFGNASDGEGSIGAELGFSGAETDLSIARLMVDAMGGKLWIDTTQKNTWFNIVIPFKFSSKTA